MTVTPSLSPMNPYAPPPPKALLVGEHTASAQMSEGTESGWRWIAAGESMAFEPEDEFAVRSLSMVHHVAAISEITLHGPAAWHPMPKGSSQRAADRRRARLDQEKSKTAQWAAAAAALAALIAAWWGASGPSIALCAIAAGVPLWSVMDGVSRHTHEGHIPRRAVTASFVCGTAPGRVTPTDAPPVSGAPSEA